MNLYLGANTNIQTVKRIIYEVGNLVNLIYDSNALVSPNFAIMSTESTYTHNGRQYFDVINNSDFESNLDSFKISGFPFEISE